MAREGLGADDFALEKYWYFDNFEGGSVIPAEARRLYRNRKDLEREFKNPFSIEYLRWFRSYDGEFKQ
jgi:hypothetical protein